MKKHQLMILTLAASAHVHGVDNNSSMLGKRERSEQEQGRNVSNKRQKTDREMVYTSDPETEDQSNALSDSQDRAMEEPIDTSTQNYAGTTRGHPIQAQNNQVNAQHGPEQYTFITRLPAGPMHTMMKYLKPKEGWQLRRASKLTCKRISAYPQGTPQRYCEQTGEWVKLQNGDNTDNCFRYFLSTLRVPNRLDALQVLENIVRPAQVHHVIIDAPDPRGGTPFINTNLLSTINAFFTTGKNNSMTWKFWSVELKIDADTIDPQPMALKIDADTIDLLTNVKNLILQGNEKIEVTLTHKMDNKHVTVQSAKSSELKYKKRSITVMGPDGKAIFENGILTGNVTDNELWSIIKDRDGWPLIGAAGPNSTVISTKIRTTYAQSEGSVLYQKKNNDNSIHTISGLGKESKISGTKNGLVTGNGTDKVLYTMGKNEKLCHETAFNAPNAQFTVTETGTIMLSGQNLEHKQYNEDGPCFTVKSLKDTDVTAIFEIQQKSMRITGQDLSFDTCSGGVFYRFKTQGTNVEFTRKEGSNGTLNNAQHIEIERQNKDRGWEAVCKLEGHSARTIDLDNLLRGV